VRYFNVVNALVQSLEKSVMPRQMSWKIQLAAITFGWSLFPVSYTVSSSQSYSTASSVHCLWCNR